MRKIALISFGIGLAAGVVGLIAYSLRWDERAHQAYIAYSGREPWLSWPS